MVGHSFGAQLARIYVNQYPDEVVGMVFVDSALDLPQFADQREYEDWVASNNILQGMLWGMTQFGLLRLTMPGTFQQWGYPAELTNELGALRSSNQALESDTQERYPYRMELNAALAEATDFGNLPLAILWAPEGITLPEAEQARLDNLRNDVAGFSTNRVVRFIEGADHGTILGNEQYAQQVTDAILDVIAAAQTGAPLTE
jgi:pimeloyl-ACP methyl ester carboxylesterase